ncbi:MAG: hypothetical protein ACT4QE_01160, partial [Anaerolineales bacterium]
GLKFHFPAIILVALSLACKTLTAPLASEKPRVSPPGSTGPPTPPHVYPIDGPTGLTRADPFTAGAVAVTPNWEVEIIESVRGVRAWQMLRDANQFNDPAPEGGEYVLVYARVTSTHTDGATHEVYATDLKLTGDQLIRYFKADGVPPEPTLEGELSNGESAEGWTVFLVAEAERNLIVIVDVLSDEGSEDVLEPAALNRTAVTPDWEITVLEAVRGAEAYDMAKETNQYNDPPAEGMEYIAVKVRARYISTEDEAVWLDSGYFQTLGSDSVEYSAPPVVDPEPALDVTLYPGGAYTGWVVVQAKIDDPTLLVFQPFVDFEKINRRYFALNP